IEPCFSCSGEPSQCVALEEGAACDDHRDCTTGETCGAGMCQGSAAAAPCFDLSGPWRWRFDYPEGDLLLREDVETNVSLEQRDGYLMRFRESGNIADSGPIDPSTGAFHLSGAPYDVKDLLSDRLCVGSVSGHPTNAGETIEAGELEATYGATFCSFWGSTVIGSRCIDGAVEAGEQCDDENVIAGDGCDPTCHIEPCFHCTGARSVCTPLIDGTSCADVDAEIAR